jgi:hypothetical protein
MKQFLFLAVLALAVGVMTVNATTYLYIDKYVTYNAPGGGDGSFLSPYTWAEAATAVKPGWRINANAGTLASGITSITFSTHGKADSLIWIRGYNVVCGDIDTNYNRTLGLPTLTFTTGQLLISGNFYRVTNIEVHSATTATGGAFYYSGTNEEIGNCRSVNTAVNAAAKAASAGNANDYTWGCYFKSNAAANVWGGAGKAVGCIFDGGLNSLSMAGVLTSISYCILYAPANACVLLTTTGIWADHCVLHKAGGDGISMTTAYSNVSGMFESCVIDSCVGYPFNNSSGTSMSLVKFNRCVAFANGKGDSLIGNSYASVFTDTTLNFRRNKIDVMTPFQNPTTWNYHLNSGSVAKRGGFPKMFDSIGLSAVPSAGAVQDDSVCATCTQVMTPHVDSNIVHLYHQYIDSMRYDTATKICTWHKPNGDITRRDTVKQSGATSTDSITKAKSLFYPAVMTYNGLADTVLLDSIAWMKFDRWKYSLTDSTQKIYNNAGTGTLKTRKGKPGTTVTRSVY